MKHELIYPAARAAITGLFAAILAVMIGYFRGDTSWAFGGLVGAAVAFIAWVLSELTKVRSIEVSPKRQVLPIYPTETTRIQITASDPAGQFQAGRFADLTISREDLTRVSKRIQAGASFSHAGLAGPGRPLTRSQFEVLRDEFIARGLAYWINPASHAQGCNLTHAGQSVIKHFASGAAHAHTNTSGNGREAVLRD